MSKAVFGYIRVSGLGQVDKDGPKRQRDAIVEFTATHGLALDPSHIYEEALAGATAGSDRPQFSKMLARIIEIRESGGEADGIVLERADRLARDLIEGELIYRECRKLGIKVFATDRGLIDLVSDDSNPTLKLIRQVIGAVNEFDKSSLVVKLKLARDRIRKEKGFCEGRPKYGSCAGEIQVLQVIKMMHAQGESDACIAAMLNGLGFRNRSGTGWTRQSVRTQIRDKCLTKPVETCTVT